MGEMFLSCKAQLEIEEICENKDFRNYPDLITGDNWIRGAAKVASILSGESEDIYLEMSPGELAKIRNKIFDVVREGYETKVKTKESKKKQTDEKSASQESG